METLTSTQQQAFEAMKKRKSVFLTGEAGTGKTYLLRVFIDWYRDNRENDMSKIYITSTTGLSSLLIDGITIHRYAGIGIGNKDLDTYIKKITQSPKTRKRWLNTRVLIIDEISMMNPELFDLLNNIAKRIKRNMEPFGGIQLILSGDFLQLPPVNSPGFCFESFSWDECIQQTFYFRQIMRQDNNIFQSVLNNIRIGICTDNDEEILSQCFDRTFQNDYGIIPTVIFPRKNMVNDYNKNELDKLLDQGNEYREYTAIYEHKKDLSEMAIKFLKDLINSEYAVEDYCKFVVGNQVMVTINIPEKGLANGSRGVITGFNEKDLPIVCFLSGKEYVIDYHSWVLDESKENISKKQIPLIHAWAITIHKAQGMTLEYVITDVGSRIFEYGQIYVVLSRVKSLEGLSIVHFDKSKIRAHPKILQYYESLL